MLHRILYVKKIDKNEEQIGVISEDLFTKHATSFYQPFEPSLHCIKVGGEQS